MAIVGGHSAPQESGQAGIIFNCTLHFHLARAWTWTSDHLACPAFVSHAVRDVLFCAHAGEGVPSRADVLVKLRAILQVADFEVRGRMHERGLLLRSLNKPLDLQALEIVLQSFQEVKVHYEGPKWGI